MLIQSALAGLMEDVIPPGQPVTYDIDGGGNPHSAFSLAADGGVLVHRDCERIEPVLAPHTDEELERGARLLLLRAARRVPYGASYRYFAEWDLPLVHTLEIPEPVVYGGLDVERGDTFLDLTDPNLLGLVARQGDLSTVVIFNPPGVVRIDPNAVEYPRAPPRRAGLREPRAVREDRLRGERRAKALLFRHLCREQKWELRAHRRFTVTGQDGLTYRVYAWQGMNVRIFDGERETHSLCVVAKPENPIPVFDLMLAQKVLLERDITKFMELAVRRTL